MTHTSARSSPVRGGQAGPGGAVAVHSETGSAGGVGAIERSRFIAGENSPSPRRSPDGVPAPDPVALDPPTPPTYTRWEPDEREEPRPCRSTSTSITRCPA